MGSRLREKYNLDTNNLHNIEPKSVLLLCHYYPGVAGAINDHIFAFEKYSKNEYFILSNLGDLPEWLDLSRFDALIIHYSLIACYDNYISPATRKLIREFRGFKSAFVQDDYRWINDTVNALSYMRINALFPLAGKDIIDIVYSPEKLPSVRKETVLAGYVPNELVTLEVKPYEDRIIDVGYRARKLPAWMGSHTLQKWQIAENCMQDVPRYNLKVDLSCKEEDRIYGSAWVEFITNCKATLGTESGASVCDFTGNIQRNVEAHLHVDPKADFNTLRELYFKDEDCKYLMNVISPRCFEAAALRTLMILYEGRYSDILVPWRHYVPLKHDHSNMDEVVHILNSPEKAKRIIEQAYKEVAMNEANSYQSMVELVDRVMDEEWTDAIVSSSERFLQNEFEWYRRHCLKTFGEKFNSEFEPALFFPTTSSDQVCRYDLESAINYFEIAFDSLNDISAITVRWSTNKVNIPKSFEIHEMRRGVIVNTRVVSNIDQKAFQIIRLPFLMRMRKLDGLRICVTTGERTYSILMVSVLARNSSSLYRYINNFKFKCMQLLHYSWAVLPEPVKRIVRPYVRIIRRLLS